MSTVGFDTNEIGLRATPYFTLIDPPFGKSLGIMVSEALQAFDCFNIPTAVRDILLAYGYPSPVVDLKNEDVLPT